YAAPVADFNFANNPCQSSTTLFNDASLIPGGTIVNWQWNFGNGNTSSLQDPSATYNSQGIFSVSLSVRSDKGCKSVPAVKTITVLPKPVAYFKNISGCQSASVSFTDSSYSNGNVVNTWYWNFGNGQTSTQQNPTASYNTAGSYTVKLVVGNSSCSSDTFTRVIT